ncbi:sugar O-acetyltransferase [Goodfellowiella coeruleoviolacea]|nr:sugar O-acetyltransferase [Goodfellowiella coeruleoviolacea]
MKDRMLRGQLYRVDEELAAELRRCALLVERYNATSTTQEPLREQLLRELLGSVGPGVVIRPPCYFDYGYQTTIGANTFVNFGAVILDVGRVSIGANVQIGPNVQFLTPTHPLDAEVRRSGLEAAEPITVGDDVWLGGGVVLCPGVSVGSRSVIGAGSVVTRDVPADVVAVGNPCRVVRQLA